MTLEALKTAPDRKAFLLGLGDEDLDRLAAFARGWIDLGPPQFCWHEESGRSACCVKDWHPSTSLDQAHELLAMRDKSLDLFYSRVEDWEHTYHALAKTYTDEGEIMLLESEAKTHARAICILAILGLIEGK